MKKNPRLRGLDRGDGQARDEDESRQSQNQGCCKKACGSEACSREARC